MTTTDGAGEMRSYLANESLFGVMKDLESKNLVIPLVGDFAGPKALRSVGRYLKDKEPGAAVGAFYLSNVEQYLGQSGLWQTFCNNVASLPLNETSRFIYSQGGAAGGGRGGGGLGSHHRPILLGRQDVGCSAGTSGEAWRQAGDARCAGRRCWSSCSSRRADVPVTAEQRGVLDAGRPRHRSRAATFATRT